MLESLHISLLFLIRLRKVFDGVVSSSILIFVPLVKFLHLIFHFSLMILLRFFFNAVGLVVSLRLSRCGRSFLSDVIPRTAFLASLSAMLLPCIPVCLAVHCSIIEYLAELCCHCICEAILMALVVIFCPGCVRSDVRVLITSLSSVPSANNVLPTFLVLMRCSPISRPINFASL